MGKETVAVYWDFENIHASLYDSANGSGSYGRTQNRSKQQDVLIGNGLRSIAIHCSSVRSS
jgi:hypothetical protein